MPTSDYLKHNLFDKYIFSDILSYICSSTVWQTLFAAKLKEITHRSVKNQQDHRVDVKG